MIIQIIGAILLLLLILAIIGAVVAHWLVTSERGPVPSIFDAARYERDRTLIITDDIHGEAAAWPSAQIADLPQRVEI